MLKEVGARRLQVLATELRTNTQREHFHMNFWFRHIGKCPMHWGQNEILAPKILHNCGATACALGTAGMIPSFRRAGLKVVGDEYGTYGQVMYRGSYGLEAAERFFHINVYDAYAIFMPKRYGERYSTLDAEKTSRLKWWRAASRKFCASTVT